MLEGREVTWFPSYGAEVRGGTANCTIIISDELIGSPVIATPDILIVMSDASLIKFLPKLRKGGLFLYDSSMIRETDLRTDIDIMAVPAAEIASKAGNTKSANMVLLGTLIAKTGLFSSASVMKALNKSMQNNTRQSIKINKEAIAEGIRFFEDKKSKDS